MPGPLPKPSALRSIQGNPGKRATNKQEPDPEYMEPGTRAPAWLDDRARAVWNELVPHFQKARLIALVDVDHFAMGCVAIAEYRLAHQKIKEDCISKSGAGGDQLNPWMIVKSMAFKQASAVFSKFGASPADRTRIALQPQMDLFSVAGGKDAQDDKNSKYFGAPSAA